MSQDFHELVSQFPWKVVPKQNGKNQDYYEIQDLDGNGIAIVKSYYDAVIMAAAVSILDSWQYMYEHFGYMYRDFGSAYNKTLQDVHLMEA